MRANRKRLMGVAVAAAVLGIAAASANYLCRPAVVDQGGGAASSSAYEVRASVGGPALGTASSANYTVDVGTIGLVESDITGDEPKDDGLLGGVLGGGCGGNACAFLAALAALALARRSRRS